MFASLNVYLKNRFCGQVSWESERNRFVFRYAAEYLVDADAERTRPAAVQRVEQPRALRARHLGADRRISSAIRRQRRIGHGGLYQSFGGY